MSQTRVTVIPPRMNLQLVPFSAEYVKKRVAAYARVSTDTEEQLSSYEAGLIITPATYRQTMNGSS